MGDAGTPTIQQIFETAVGHHGAGRLPEAESGYRQVLDAVPNHPVALHLLGVIAHQVGQNDVAAELISNAVAVQPDYAEAHNNLGATLKELGRFDDALASYQQAIAIKPDYADAHYNLGNTLAGQGKVEDAVRCFQKAVEIKPDHPTAHNNLGNAFKELGRLEDAAASFRRATEVMPNYAEAHNNLGNVLVDLGTPDHALDSFNKALAVTPEFAEAHSNLGNALQNMGRRDDAVASFQKALEISPDFAQAHYNLGNVLKELGNLDEAISSFQNALAHQPDYPEAHNNLGAAFQALGQRDNAAASYAQAIEVKPGYAEAHNNLGLLQLLAGEFHSGWKNYEWRWRLTDNDLRSREYSQPLWDGGPLDGKTIFVYPEQGSGDTIQFVRYLPLLEALGARVYFETPGNLQRLLEGGMFAAMLIAKHEPPPSFNCHAALMDLPRLLDTTLETIPDITNYFKVPTDLAEDWSHHILANDSTAIGLAWAGSSTHKNDQNRSIDAALLRPLAEIADVSLYSLQLERPGEAAQVFGDRIIDLSPPITDFADTAAAMQHLDLIISVDTSVAHLAGTLGKPIWTLLPFIPDWRWLLERDDSPWYATMRLFRQTDIGNWADVIGRVGESLKEFKP